MIESVGSEFGLSEFSYGPVIMRLTLVHPDLGPPELYHTKSLDEALSDTFLHNVYQSAKPVTPGCRVQLISEEGYRPIATCMSVADDQTIAVQLGTPQQWEEYERPGEILTRLSTTEMITGTPFSRIQMERRLFKLRQVVLWSWPTHLEPEEVCFTLKQEVVDEEDTNVTTSEIRWAMKGNSGVEHPQSFVLSKLGIQVGEQHVPVFVHPKDVLTKSFFAELLGL